jgi:uncharacterized membrane protein
MSKYVEKKYRTITKILVWQLIAVCITVTILIIAIGDINKALTYGVIDHSICLICHYFYDRMWGKLNWGLEVQDDGSGKDVYQVNECNV